MELDDTLKYSLQVFTPEVVGYHYLNISFNGRFNSSRVYAKSRFQTDFKVFFEIDQQKPRP